MCVGGAQKVRNAKRRRNLSQENRILEDYKNRNKKEKCFRRAWPVEQIRFQILQLESSDQPSFEILLVPEQPDQEPVWDGREQEVFC